MSEISKQALKVDNSTSFPNNTTGYISPTILRAFNVNMIDSLVDEITYTADSSSWNVSIGQLNTYTSSFAPSLTQLNAFTASQLTINTGVNGFTQSANASINRLDTFSSSFNAYTASINQIRSNNVFLGYSTIFNLVGPGTFFSASLVQNVQGNIATLTFSSDAAKVNTSSFNDYTASTNAAFNQYTQSINQFSASANVSILALNAYTASDDNSIDLINAFTQSATQQINSLISATGSYATTGSNIFYGEQIIQNNGLSVYGQYPFATLQANAQGSGSQYPTFNITLDSQAYLQDGVIGGYQVQDPSTNNSVALGINTYSTIYGFPNPVPMIYGQGSITGGDDTLIAFPAGRIDMWRNTNISGALNLTGSLISRGNNTFNGNQTITGSVLISSSAAFDLIVSGAIDTFGGPIRVVAAAGSTGSLQPTFLAIASGSAGTPQYLQSLIARGYSQFASGSNQISLHTGANTLGGLNSANVGGGIAVSSGSAGTYYYPIQFQSTTAYTDGRVTFATPISASAGFTGSVQFRDSLTITGSVYGNIETLSITSNTASMNLSRGNFFTLNLVSGSTTHLTATNIRPGQTINLLLTQPSVGTGSLSYNSTFDFPAGGNYIATPITSSKDIITFITFDTATIYATSINNLV